MKNLFLLFIALATCLPATSRAGAEEVWDQAFPEKAADATTWLDFVPGGSELTVGAAWTLISSKIYFGSRTALAQQNNLAALTNFEKSNPSLAPLMAEKIQAQAEVYYWKYRRSQWFLWKGDKEAYKEKLQDAQARLQAASKSAAPAEALFREELKNLKKLSLPTGIAEEVKLQKTVGRVSGPLTLLGALVVIDSALRIATATQNRDSGPLPLAGIINSALNQSSDTQQ